MLTSLGASLLMVFSDSHQTAAPATGMDTAMPAHHIASFLASEELNIDRPLPLLSLVMMLYSDQWMWHLSYVANLSHTVDPLYLMDAQFPLLCAKYLPRTLPDTGEGLV